MDGANFITKITNLLLPKLGLDSQRLFHLMTINQPKQMQIVAVITPILKKSKDPEEVGGYRPISLLNVDQKILAKILSNRLNRYMSMLGHMDETGFIPGRTSF